MAPKSGRNPMLERYAMLHALVSILARPGVPMTPKLRTKMNNPIAASSDQAKPP